MVMNSWVSLSAKQLLLLHEFLNQVLNQHYLDLYLISNYLVKNLVVQLGLKRPTFFTCPRIQLRRTKLCQLCYKEEHRYWNQMPGGHGGGIFRGL